MPLPCSSPSWKAEPGWRGLAYRVARVVPIPPSAFPQPPAGSRTTGRTVTDMPPTMERPALAINGDVLALAQGDSISELKRRIVEVVRAGGGFVDLTVVGNRVITVFFTTHTQMTITLGTVEFDARDDGDSAAPYTSNVLDIGYTD